MGHEPGDITSLAVLLTFENYQRILRFLLDRHDGKDSPQVAHMAAFLKSVVRHWLKVDVLRTLNVTENCVASCHSSHRHDGEESRALASVQ